MTESWCSWCIKASTASAEQMFRQLAADFTARLSDYSSKIHRLHSFLVGYAFALRQCVM